MGKARGPKKWINCPEMCSEAAFGKFVAFKTPYSRSGNSQTGKTFTVSSAFQLAEERGMKMGMWFDCTNSDEFYDGLEVESSNCIYVKLKCSGVDMGQTRSLLKKFKSLCNEFFEEHPDMLVGVHCTHGFNRTGFFIVSYMVDECGWNILAAVNEFARVRPPGIYRQNKLADLSRKYKVVLRGPSESPPWEKAKVKHKNYQSEKNTYETGPKAEDNNKSDGGWKSVPNRSRRKHNFQSNHKYDKETCIPPEEYLSWRKTSSSPRHFQQSSSFCK